MFLGMTVETLFNECKEQIAKGNGKKRILISADDEGNDYHPLYYSFTDDTETLNELNQEFDLERQCGTKDFVVLG